MKITFVLKTNNINRAYLALWIVFLPLMLFTAFFAGAFEGLFKVFIQMKSDILGVDS